MNKYELRDCEPLFKRKKRLKDNIDGIKFKLDGLFSIIQNDGIILSDDDLRDYSNQLENFDAYVSSVMIDIDNDIIDILEHIVSHKVTK